MWTLSNFFFLVGDKVGGGSALESRVVSKRIEYCANETSTVTPRQFTLVSSVLSLSNLAFLLSPMCTRI